MAYERKIEKLSKIAATVAQLVRDDTELRLEVLNSEDTEAEGFKVVVVLRFEPAGTNEIL